MNEPSPPHQPATPAPTTGTRNRQSGSSKGPRTPNPLDYEIENKRKAKIVAAKEKEMNAIMAADPAYKATRDAQVQQNRQTIGRMSQGTRQRYLRKRGLQ